MSENYDATWLDYMPTVSYGPNYVYTTSSNTWAYDSLKKISNDPPAPAEPAAMKKKNSSDRESKESMDSNNVFSSEDRDDIDEAVRDAIIAPRKAAEIANRKAAVEALGVEDKRVVGTVLTFKRLIGKTTYLLVALKTGEDAWAVTGTPSANFTKTWDQLLTWMTTGDNLVSDVQVATEFESISWEIATASPVTV